MNFTKSSRKSWSLIQRLGAAQNPPRTSHPAESKLNGGISSRHALDKSLPPAFTVDEIYQVLQNMKAGTAPGYDHVHPEFLKNLGLRAQTWLSRFFSRIIIVNTIPNI